jgi:hypothetical protein
MNTLKLSVIQGGRTNKVITLPKAWCDKENVTKGSELDVLIVGGMLILPPRSMNNEQIEQMLSEARVMIESVMRERGKI